MCNERVIAIWGFLSLGHSVGGLLTFRHAQGMCYRNVGEFQESTSCYRSEGPFPLQIFKHDIFYFSYIFLQDKKNVGSPGSDLNH